MILFCTGHGAHGGCIYIPYHDMAYQTAEQCQIALELIQKVKHPDVAPELICEPNRKT